MKIEIEIPDWPKEEKCDLHILAGIEVIATKKYGKRWYIKTERCNMCGKCCMNVPKNWPHGQGEDGNCKYLVEYPPDKYICDLRGDRSYQCCVGDDSDEDYCSIKWKIK